MRNDPLAAPTSTALVRAQLQETTALLRQLEDEEVARQDADAPCAWKTLVRIDMALCVLTCILFLVGLILAQHYRTPNSAADTAASVLFTVGGVVFVAALGVTCLHPHGRARLGLCPPPPRRASLDALVTDARINTHAGE
jgi:hypothetical protein